MYERFTDRARKVMQLANQEAQRFNHEYIGTEHILLGLVKEDSGVAANALENLHIDRRKVRIEIEKILQSGPSSDYSGKLPQTPRAKKVIEYAIEEARNLVLNYVGTEHLLLGLLREEEGVAAQVLMNLGLSLASARAEVMNLLCIEADNPVHLQTAPEATAPAQAHELPPSIERAINYLDAVIDQLNEIKVTAVATQDFEWAVMLRDQQVKLKQVREFLFHERHRESKDRSNQDHS